MIKDETYFVVSRSYGDETKYFPVALCFHKREADSLCRIFGGIITEVPRITVEQFDDGIYGIGVEND